MLKVAARYDVSSSYMVGICTLLNVPRPQRGYRAKLVVGEAPKKPDLPVARHGDEPRKFRIGQYCAKEDNGVKVVPMVIMS